MWVTPTSSAFSVAPANVKAHVMLLSEKYAPRTWNEVGGTRQVVSYIQHHFEAHGGDVYLQRFDVGEREEQANVIARYGADEGPLVIVGAHYDSYEGTPGADDNASGVAVLLELGTILKRFPLNNIRLELVAFASEEPPHFQTERMGSAQYVSALKESRENPALVLILEMVGFFTDEPNSQAYPIPGLELLYPSVGNFVAVIGNLSPFSPTYSVKVRMLEASSLPVYSLNAPRFIPGVDFSDHQSFWDAGMNAVMITDTAFFRNPNYHELTDTTDTLDYSRMSEVVAGVYAVLKAENEARQSSDGRN